MSDLFPRRPPAPPERHPATELLDPRRATARSRWEARTAQWRARELAEAVWGAEVEVRLAGRPGRDFRGLMHVAVPFESLADHDRLQALFTASARRDPVLGSVPVVWVFQPVVR